MLLEWMSKPLPLWRSVTTSTIRSLLVFQFIQGAFFFFTGEGHARFPEGERLKKKHSRTEKSHTPAPTPHSLLSCPVKTVSKTFRAVSSVAYNFCQAHVLECYLPCSVRLRFIGLAPVSAWEPSFLKSILELRIPEVWYLPLCPRFFTWVLSVPECVGLWPQGVLI